MRVGKKIEDFEFKIYHKGEAKTVRFSDYFGKWIVLFFYPSDFTFVCPTELLELANNYNKFKELNAEIFGVSTDSVFVHKAWQDISPAVSKVEFPLIADKTGELSKYFGTYIEEDGMSYRGTFIIDPDGILRALEVNDKPIGRNVSELLRKLTAAKHVREHGEEACPVNWKPGDKTLKPSLDLVGKI